MKPWWLGLSMLGLALAACGGRAIEQPGTGGSAPSAPAPSAVSASQASSSDPLPSHDLEPCVPGFDRAQNPTLPCYGLTESGMCFDDTESACACICPTDRVSVCSHGFDDGAAAARPIYCE